MESFDEENGGTDTRFFYLFYFLFFEGCDVICGFGEWWATLFIILVILTFSFVFYSVFLGAILKSLTGHIFNFLYLEKWSC